MRSTTGKESQPHSCGYGGKPLIPFALITVAIPARATGLCFRPATQRSIRRRCSCRFSPNPCSLVRPDGAYSSSSTLFVIELVVIINIYKGLSRGCSPVHSTSSQSRNFNPTKQSLLVHLGCAPVGRGTHIVQELSSCARMIRSVIDDMQMLPATRSDHLLTGPAIGVSNPTPILQDIAIPARRCPWCRELLHDRHRRRV